MEKFKAKLHSLSQDRRYMISVGGAIIIIGLIGLGSSGFAVFLDILLGTFCLLVGYYGSDIKKGMEELKKDVMEAKDAATVAAHKTAEVAKESASKVGGSVKKEVEKSAPKKTAGKK